MYKAIVTDKMNMNVDFRPCRVMQGESEKDMEFVFKLVVKSGENEFFNLHEEEKLLQRIHELKKQGLVGYEDFYTDIVRKEQAAE